MAGTGEGAPRDMPRPPVQTPEESTTTSSTQLTTEATAESTGHMTTERWAKHKEASAALMATEQTPPHEGEMDGVTQEDQPADVTGAEQIASPSAKINYRITVDQTVPPVEPPQVDAASGQPTLPPANETYVIPEKDAEKTTATGERHAPPEAPARRERRRSTGATGATRSKHDDRADSRAPTPRSRRDRPRSPTVIRPTVPSSRKRPPGHHSQRDTRSEGRRSGSRDDVIDPKRRKQQEQTQEVVQQLTKKKEEHQQLAKEMGTIGRRDVVPSRRPQPDQMVPFSKHSVLLPDNFQPGTGVQTTEVESAQHINLLSDGELTPLPITDIDQARVPPLIYYRTRVGPHGQGCCNIVERASQVGRLIADLQNAEPFSMRDVYHITIISTHTNSRRTFRELGSREKDMLGYVPHNKESTVWPIVIGLFTNDSEGGLITLRASNNRDSMHVLLNALREFLMNEQNVFICTGMNASFKYYAELLKDLDDIIVPNLIDMKRIYSQQTSPPFPYMTQQENFDMLWKSKWLGTHFKIRQVHTYYHDKSLPETSDQINQRNSRAELMEITGKDVTMAEWFLRAFLINKTLDAASLAEQPAWNDVREKWRNDLHLTYGAMRLEMRPPGEPQTNDVPLKRLAEVAFDQSESMWADHMRSVEVVPDEQLAMRWNATTIMEAEMQWRYFVTNNNMLHNHHARWYEVKYQFVTTIDLALQQPVLKAVRSAVSKGKVPKDKMQEAQKAEFSRTRADRFEQNERRILALRDEQHCLENPDYRVELKASYTRTQMKYVDPHQYIAVRARDFDVMTQRQRESDAKASSATRQTLGAGPGTGRQLRTLPPKRTPPPTLVTPPQRPSTSRVMNKGRAPRVYAKPYTTESRAARVHRANTEETEGSQNDLATAQRALHETLQTQDARPRPRR